MREQLAAKYIRGRGIEIGGLHNCLPIPHGAKVTYVDRLPPDQAHPDVKNKVQNIVIDDAELLQHPVCNNVDFIIANHVLEHCHDPIGTLYTWFDRLASGGIAYIALPEKNHTFDKPREVTKLSHIILDYQSVNTITRDAEHYQEWLSIIDGVKEPELSKRVKQCQKDRANIHFHVWDRQSMQEMFNYVSDRFQIVESKDNGAEVIWILRKP